MFATTGNSEETIGSPPSIGQSSITFNSMRFARTFPSIVSRAVWRTISTNALKCKAETVTATKRDEYYKNISAQTQNFNEKPSGWNEALPFEAIPGPKSTVILTVMGLLSLMGLKTDVSVIDMNKKLQKRYGDIVNIGKPIGKRPLVFVYNPNDMEHIFRNAGPYPIRNGLEAVTYYRTKVRPEVYKGVGGVALVHGEEWFKYRSMANPILMQPRTTQRYIRTMDTVANDLVKNIRCLAKERQNNEMPEDFQNELYKWSLESVGIVAFNRRLGCLKLDLEKGSEAQRFITSVVKSLDMLYYLDVLPHVWRIFSTKHWKEYVECSNVLTDIALKYIDEALAENVPEDVPEHELSVLHKLLRVDKQFALTMVIDMVAAGVDTTGKTLAAALYFLAKNPEKQARLREEAIKKSSRTKFSRHGRSPGQISLSESDYKRNHKVGPNRYRKLEANHQGFGYQKNVDVVAVNFLSSRDSDQYKEPDKFIPDRFLRTTTDEYSVKNAHPFATLPFGHGPRSCIGKRLANLELEVAIAKICRNFELTWPHEDMKFDIKLLYGIADPLKLRVKPLQA
ncbi:hypothetical protein NQ317_009326 [Molorchus minor]|uniref:Uncharacterized protein n=1 Tax=Molorchus minor TaxID=1323400 RepID=A0ABQ9JH08_9CUCU|nr:hypothetical protein NQ317_009326 [Molorchus minor]